MRSWSFARHGSAGNHQAWVAVEKNAPPDFSRRLRKGAGADPTASGSTLSGSLNFKTKYAPAFPLVEITHANAGRITTTAALDEAGFVAAPSNHDRHDRKPMSSSQDAGKMAELSALRAGSAADPRRGPARHFQSGFHMGQDRHRMGMERRGHGKPPDGSQQQGEGERRTLRGPNCHPSRGVR